MVNMRNMVDEQHGDDMRLLGIAYLEFFAKDDKENMRLLERDRRLIARSVGSFAFFLMDSVYIPDRHGIAWTQGWVEVDFRKRTDPEFAATLYRRGRYRRMSQGLVLFPRRHLRKVTHDVARMLCVAYISEAPSEEPVKAREAILYMLQGLRERFCHTGDAPRNA